MTLKQFKGIKLFFVFIIAITFSQAVILKSFIIPLIILIASYLILLLLRRRVTEVIADERDYAIGGRAALWAIQVYSWTAAIIMIILFSLRSSNIYFEPIASVLAYSTCFLMILYSIIFRYYSKSKSFKI